jgi:hypothetical protein
MATKTPRVFPLRDVDGTVKGAAMLVTTDLSAGWDAQPMHTTFVEGEHGCVDPRRSCIDLWESIKNDWPGHSYGVVMNERARYLSAQGKIRRMLGEQHVESPREYWQENA